MIVVEQLLKGTLLFLSRNKVANRVARKYGLRFGAERFVAGESITAAIQAVRKLNDAGIMATLDHLGEFVMSEEDAAVSAQFCLETLRAIDQAGIRSNLSLKLTQLGLDISGDLCLNHMRRILDCAVQYRNFVRIDMEDYTHNERTIDIFRQLHSEYGNSVGLVIQAYLYKSEQDVEHLGPLKPNLRLVKGAYKEKPEVAFPGKTDVDDNFVRLIQQHLLNGNYTAIATHDLNVIQQSKKFTQEYNIPRTQYEFQMLYGIRRDIQKELVEDGYRVRVYVPYGNDWYGYFMRRMAERPANLGFVLKSMFKR